MSTNKGFWRRAVLWTVVGTLGLLGTARADVVADQAAAILVFPKIEVDTTSSNDPNKPKVDTVVQITNTSPFLTRARCYYVNANGKCSNAGQVNGPDTAPVICRETADCNPGAIQGGICIPGWEERDFQLTLTKRQPLSWNASSGLRGDDVPLTNGRTSKDGQSNDPTSIPPVLEDPFIGELKCVQVDTATEEPIDRNDLKGEATITTVLPETGGVDVRKYNAVGIQATGFQDGDPTTLTLGGPDAEYNACPNVVLLDHYFDSLDLSPNSGVESHNDGSGNPLVSGRVATDLIIVPCSEDFLTQDPKYGSAVLQFLIYNEFEQRFSSSTRVDCFKQIQLSDINTRPGPSDNASSIFSQSVQGTLTGQTRIRPVSGFDRAHRVLIMAEERWEAAKGPMPIYTTARNVQNIQPVFPTDAPLPDIIKLSPLVQ